MMALSFARVFDAPLATRPRRALLWTFAMGGLLAVAVLQVTFALASVVPTPTTAAALDVGVMVALALVYRLLLDRLGATASRPLRTLAGTAGAFAVAAVATAALGIAVAEPLDPTTRLPSTLAAVAGTAAGLVQVLVAVGVLVALRPLLLYGRRQAVVAAWRVALGAGAGSAIALAGSAPGAPPSTLSLVLHVAAVLAATGLALRQGALAMLTGRERWLGVFGSASLLGAVAAVQWVRHAGPGVLAVGAGEAAVTRLPLGALFSLSSDAVVTVVSNGTAVFAAAALLALVIGLPGTLSPAQRAGERRALRALTTLSGQVLHGPELAEAIARGPVEAGLADAAWLTLSDPASGSLAPVVVAAEGWSLGEATAAADSPALVRAAAEGTLVLPRAAADHRVRTRPGRGVGSLAVLPLAAGNRTGALVAVRRSADAFEADDVAALETFAGQAALAISHADLFADALDRARLARELSLAREVQKRLFPQSLPVVDGLELAAAERPAREVGGDYYDVVRLHDACVGLLVADVSGKGAAAAFYMAEMKGIVQAASRLTRAPSELLVQANDALASSLSRGAFVSAAYAVVDADAGTVAVGRAGHCPPVLARDPARADGGRWLLRPAGLALGLDRTGHAFRRVLREQTVHLVPGDVLVLYTDGLVEVRNPDGEEYGYERLADAIAALRARPADEIREALLDAHRVWADGADPADDLSLVVMRWTGRAAVPAPLPGSMPPVTDRPAFP